MPGTTDHDIAPEAGSAGSDQVTYRVADAAKQLALSQRYVKHLIKTGALDSFKVGRARLITRDALFAFVRERQAETAA
jgi:excisionase family DNA binding protein